MLVGYCCISVPYWHLFAVCGFDLLRVDTWFDDVNLLRAVFGFVICYAFGC